MAKKQPLQGGIVLGPYNLYNLDGSPRTPTFMDVGVGTNQDPLPTAALAKGFVNFWFMPTDVHALQVVLTKEDAMDMGARIAIIAATAKVDSVKRVKRSAGKKKAAKASQTAAGKNKKKKKK